MKIIIFGTGQLYKKYKDRLSFCEIVAFLDNDINKQGKILDGHLVDSPNNVFINNYHYDFIIILSKFYLEMREQLLRIGVPADRIIDKEHRCGFPQIRYVNELNAVDNLQLNKGKILLVTHAMNYTGAPLMLYNMAKVLKRNQFEVCVYTEYWGELVMKYLQAGIHVHKFDDFAFSEGEIELYFSKYDMIVVNTVVLFRLITKLKSLQKPIIWWLHEEEDTYRTFHIEKKDITRYAHLHIYGVGNRAINAFRAVAGETAVKQLVYGIDHEENTNQVVMKEKLTFAVIGFVCKRKAQNFFVQAVRENWHLWKDKARFVIVGDIAKDQRNEIEKGGIIQVTGAIDHDKMLEIYSAIDVVVCPSLYDPMPVVLAEGMMNRKICIASDMTGTAEFIEPYRNGLICKAGDVGSLSECIQWVIDHRDKMAEIGEQAYETYKNHFSMKSFEQNVMSIVDQYIYEE